MSPSNSKSTNIGHAQHASFKERHENYDQTTGLRREVEKMSSRFDLLLDLFALQDTEFTRLDQASWLLLASERKVVISTVKSRVKSLKRQIKHRRKELPSRLKCCGRIEAIESGDETTPDLQAASSSHSAVQIALAKRNNENVLPSVKTSQTLDDQIKINIQGTSMSQKDFAEASQRGGLRGSRMSMFIKYNSRFNELRLKKLKGKGRAL